MTNIVEARFCFGSATKTRGLYQWDYGQVLKFVGLTLPDAYTVHFANQLLSGNAKTQVGDADGVTIPDEYLTTGLPVYAWVFLHTGEDDGETCYSVMIPVTQRPKPVEDAPTPVQQGVIDQAIAALNAAVSEANAAIEHYPVISGGVWYVWDVTAGEYVSTGVAATGADGVSPYVTVSEITGGHRVTVTDAQGPHTFDVMDGEDGYTPTISAKQTATGAIITIRDKDGPRAVSLSNGEPGADGVSAYVWIKYAAVQPTSDADMKTTPDAWIGIYSGDAATAPTHYTDYVWYDIKGDPGPAGAVQDVQVNGTSILNNGVANVPIMTESIYGIARVSLTFGTEINDGKLRVVAAPASHYKSGSGNWRPVTPYHQHEATFYGLAKAAGDGTQSESSNAVGQYTDSAKSAISQMLNSPVTITGSTPTITALPGIQYVCGEVSTLDITLPASGIVDVVFESGSTPTVLTVTPQTGMTTEWANGFDSTSLEADTLYELNIKMVGTKCLGVAGQWT